MTELLNLHVRRCFEECGGTGLEYIFSANWLLNAYNEVTIGKGSPKNIPELQAFPNFKRLNDRLKHGRGRTTCRFSKQRALQRRKLNCLLCSLQQPSQL